MAWTSIYWVLYALRAIHGAWHDSACSVSNLRGAWLKVASKGNKLKDYSLASRHTLCCRWSIGARLHLVSFWELPDTQLVGRLRAAVPRSCLMLWLRIYEVSAVKSFRIGRCVHSANCLRLEWFSAI